ncbi:MAG: helix-turn-helix domain-containing protein [Rhodocyclaceae bacterium]
MKRTPVLTPVIPMNPVERRIFIKSQLEIRGLSFAAIGRREGVSRIAVSQAAAGGPSARLQDALAEAIEIPVQTLFPERFDGKGRRITPVRCAEDNRYAHRVHGQSAEAA